MAGTFCRTWREDLCHFTHQFVSCSFLFRAMENPPTSAALAELDYDPDSPHLDQFPPGQPRSSLGLYHSLHNHLRHPDDRRTTWKEGRRCRSRSCSWLFHRSKATASCRRLASIGGIPRCSQLCPWENGQNACVKLRSLSTHSSICFYFAVAFLHSGQPGFQLLLVRSSFFRLIIFRLVRHDCFIFFFSSLSSLFVCSVFQGNHDESSALATQCETPCATRLKLPWNLYYIKSNWYDLRNSQMPHYAPAYTWEPPIANGMARAGACVQLHIEFF